MKSYRHSGDAITRLVDDQAFIISDNTILNLTPSASVMWLAFEKPASKAEALELLKQIYPTVDAGRLARDLGALVKTLLAQRLLVDLNVPAARRAVRRRSTAR